MFLYLIISLIINLNYSGVADVITNNIPTALQTGVALSGHQERSAAADQAIAEAKTKLIDAGAREALKADGDLCKDKYKTAPEALSKAIIAGSNANSIHPCASHISPSLSLSETKGGEAVTVAAQRCYGFAENVTKFAQYAEINGKCKTTTPTECSVNPTTKECIEKKAACEACTKAIKELVPKIQQEAREYCQVCSSLAQQAKAKKLGAAEWLSISTLAAGLTAGIVSELTKDDELENPTCEEQCTEYSGDEKTLCLCGRVDPNGLPCKEDFECQAIRDSKDTCEFQAQEICAIDPGNCPLIINDCECSKLSMIWDPKKEKCVKSLGEDGEDGGMEYTDTGVEDLPIDDTLTGEDDVLADDTGTGSDISGFGGGLAGTDKKDDKKTDKKDDKNALGGVKGLTGLASGQSLGTYSALGDSVSSETGLSGPSEAKDIVTSKDENIFELISKVYQEATKANKFYTEVKKVKK